MTIQSMNKYILCTIIATAASFALYGCGSAHKVVKHIDVSFERYDEDSIQAIKKRLLAVPDTAANFLFSGDDDLYKNDTEAFRLMNRMMQMNLEAASAGDQWAWRLAVNDCIDEYNRRQGYSKISKATRENAIKAISKLIAEYCAGNQPQMNTYTYVNAVIDTYNILSFYDELINSSKNKDMARLLYGEYCLWYKIHSLQCEILHEHTYMMAFHSASSMEINEQISFWQEKRHEELRQEVRIFNGEAYQNKAAIVTPEELTAMTDWYIRYWLGARKDEEEAKKCIERVRAGTFEETLPDRFDVQRAALQLEAALNKWLAVRQEIANLLPENHRVSYRELTQKIFRRFLDDTIELQDFVT